mmetsp:Transcript_13363/g.33629  ORF Transcript_13363/g.33629 Transcript_13363/m.33629 type:complete len:144 (+) Transcript_13363:166-597(+)
MMGLSKTNVKTKTALILASVVLACLSIGTDSFSTTSLARTTLPTKSSLVILRSEEEETTEPAAAAEKMSLEEKMKSWEASEEEIRAASLGGVVPQPRDAERTDAFDVGLYIAFPIMVLTGLAFAVFPFIMGNIDVSDIVVPTE